MKYYPLAKSLSIILLLTLTPLLLLIEFKSNSVPYIIIFFQFVLIWAQVEIALRQHILFSVQFEPFFEVKFSAPDEPNHEFLNQEASNLFIHNVSKNPAYSIMAARIFDEQKKPIPPDNWKTRSTSRFISVLAPDQTTQLCSLKDRNFFKNKTIEVLYHNQLGEMREIWINLLENGDMIILLKERQAPGILLNSFEYLSFFFKWLYISRYNYGD
jgi:hypothetical protein